MSAGQGRGQPVPPRPATEPARGARGGPATLAGQTQITSEKQNSPNPQTRNRLWHSCGSSRSPASSASLCPSRWPSGPPTESTPCTAPTGKAPGQEALEAGALGQRHSRPPLPPRPHCRLHAPGERTPVCSSPVLRVTHTAHHLDVGILSQEAVAGHGLETKQNAALARQNLQVADAHRMEPVLPCAKGSGWETLGP